MIGIRVRSHTMRLNMMGIGTRSHNMGLNMTVIGISSHTMGHGLWEGIDRECSSFLPYAFYV